jgi:hypothetical protein
MYFCYLRANVAEMKCLNCKTVYDGNFCPECGQKAIEMRYTLKGMITDLFFSVAHLEKKGLPNTVKMLCRNPGQAIKNFLTGHRQTLYPPFKYLVLIGAIVILFSARYKFFHNELTKSDSMDMNVIRSWVSVSDEALIYVSNFFHFAEDKATVLNIISIPIFAFFSWAFLSGRRYNFAENLILNAYITAQQLLFILALVPFLEFFPGIRHQLISGYAALILMYNVWVYIDFYPGKKVFIAAKAIVVVLISYLYQFPVNFLVFYLYNSLVHKRLDTLPTLWQKL